MQPAAAVFVRCSWIACSTPSACSSPAPGHAALATGICSTRRLACILGLGSKTSALFGVFCCSLLLSFVSLYTFLMGIFGSILTLFLLSSLPVFAGDGGTRRERHEHKREEGMEGRRRGERKEGRRSSVGCSCRRRPDLEASVVVVEVASGGDGQLARALVCHRERGEGDREQGLWLVWW